MPLTYRIEKVKRLVIVEYNKNPTFAEFENTMEAVFKNSNYEPGFGILLDRHRIDEPPSTEYIKRAVDFLRKHEIKLASLAIVVNNDATYGMERMAQILAENIDVKMNIFTNLDQAKQWLQSP